MTPCSGPRAANEDGRWEVELVEFSPNAEVMSRHLGVSENRGYLISVSLYYGSDYLGYDIGIPYSRKLPFGWWGWARFQDSPLSGGG